MTFNDILLEQQMEKARKLDLAWMRFQEEAERLDRAAHPHGGVFAGLRRVLASGLVRASIWIDRRAGERAFSATAQ